MSDFNHQFLEGANVESAFGPVDMTTAANNGQWVSLTEYQKCVAVLFAAAGTSGDDPVISVNQARDNAGTGSKGLSFTRIRQKAGTTLPGVDMLVTQSAASSYTATGTAAQKKIVAIEINGADLDVANAFTHVQVSVAKTGSSQLGSAFYVMLDPRHEQSIPASALT
jgi:hypothetical protein